MITGDSTIDLPRRTITIAKSASQAFIAQTLSTLSCASAPMPASLRHCDASGPPRSVMQKVPLLPSPTQALTRAAPSA